MQKAKRDDFRLEEELRSAKAKYEEANEDVFRRMQDIQDAEADSIRDLTRFLDVELDYHERCAETLRQTRANWPADASGGSPVDSHGGSSRRPSARSRSNTAQGPSASFSRSASYSHDHAPSAYEEPDEMPSTHMRVPIRSQSRISTNSAASAGASNRDRDRDRERDRSPAAQPLRPTVSRSSTYSLSRTPSAGLSVVPPPAMNNVASLRGQLRPTARPAAMDVFRDDDDTESSDTPPGSASPATSYSSSSRTNLSNGAGALGKKAPPPPPNRAKKPPPPVPNRREREV